MKRKDKCSVSAKRKTAIPGASIKTSAARASSEQVVFQSIGLFEIGNAEYDWSRYAASRYRHFERGR